MKEQYKRYLKIAESSRYEGFDEHLECINKAQIAEDFKSLQETIQKVKNAVKKLLQQEAWKDLVSKFLKKDGTFIDSFKNKLYGKFESLVKAKHRALNDAEVEDKIKETAKEESLNTTDDVTCIEDSFNMNDFITDEAYLPPMSDKIKSNLKRVHSELVVPIMKYYRGTREAPDNNKCYFKITAGLVNTKYVVQQLRGTKDSPHTKGLAIDFYIEGIDTAKIFKDICDKKINITWGVVFNRGASIHITLPYYKFKNFILTTNTGIEPFSTGISFAGKLLGKLFN